MQLRQRRQRALPLDHQDVEQADEQRNQEDHFQSQSEGESVHTPTSKTRDWMVTTEGRVAEASASLKDKANRDGCRKHNDSLSQQN